MILIVTGIGSLIHLYSTAYMHEETDGEFARYFSYLNLFAAFMLVLVLGANFPVMFIGWEGVGLCSYLLIGFWFTKQTAADAGKKAFVVNRIGDFGFILGMAAIFAAFGTLDFQQVAFKVAQLPTEATFGLLSGITLLLFLGATGKSAQLPLYVWLPDAMEGPTPVSALIHAATMVTAGVYMIGRNAVIFSHAPITLDVVAIVGCVTALMAGTIGLVQNDIKRVLAYSTVSQLGYMFLAMGVGAFAGGIFHLYTHAFFKALLFLGSGAVIHALHGEQDLRNMGGLRKELPITYWTFLDRHARDCRRAAPLGVLLEGRDSLADVRERPHGAVGAGGADGVPDRDLHVPPAVSGVLRRAACGAGGADGHGAHGAWRTITRPATARICTTRRRRWRLRSSCWRSAPSLAGYVGVPSVAARQQQLESLPRAEFRSADRRGHRRRSEPGDSSRRTRPAADAAAEEGSTSTELGADGLSMLVALAGIGVATLILPKNRPAIADTLAERFSGLHKLLLGKYYVDELYDAVIVQPIKRHVDVLPLARRRRRPGRRHGQRRRVRGARFERGPPAAADRLGARLRDVAFRGRGGDRGVFPVAMTGILTTLVLVPLGGRRRRAAHGPRPRRARAAGRARRVARDLRHQPRRSGGSSTRRRPTTSSSSATRGCRTSASRTTSASTASACCSSS